MKFNEFDKIISEATGDSRFDAMMTNIVKGAAANKNIETLKSLPDKSTPESMLGKFGMELISQLEKLCQARCGPNRTMQDKPDIEPRLSAMAGRDDGGEQVANILMNLYKISSTDIKEFARAFNQHGDWPWQYFATAWTQGEWADYKRQWTDGYLGSLGSKSVPEAKLTGKYRPRQSAQEKFRSGMKAAGYDMAAAGQRLSAFLNQQAQERQEIDRRYAELDKKHQDLIGKGRHKSDIAEQFGLEFDQHLNENLRNWFQEKWVRFGPDGKIRGQCARGDDSEGKPKCLPQAKAHALGQKGRKYAASKKRREDPNPERRGPAKNIATKKPSNEAYGRRFSDNRRYHQVYGDPGENPNRQRIRYEVDPYGAKTYYNVPKDKEDIAKQLHMKQDQDGRWYLPSFVIGSPPDDDLSQLIYTIETYFGRGERVEPKSWFEGLAQEQQQCPECGGPAYSNRILAEKKDACYHKVRSRYKVWPSAYASGALVQCRKKGAKNWGKKSQ